MSDDKDRKFSKEFKKDLPSFLRSVKENRVVLNRLGETDDINSGGEKSDKNKELVLGQTADKPMSSIVPAISDSKPPDFIDDILNDVKKEVIHAGCIWQPFNSLHEAYAIVLEEMDELWEEIKRSQKELERIEYVKEEGIQVAAMIVRLILDCCDKK